MALCRTQHLCFSFPSWKTGAKIQNHVTSPAAIKGLGLSLPLPVKVIWLEGRAPGPGGGGERGRISVRCQREPEAPGAGLWLHPGGRPAACLAVGSVSPFLPLSTAGVLPPGHGNVEVVRGCHLGPSAGGFVVKHPGFVLQRAPPEPTTLILLPLASPRYPGFTFLGATSSCGSVHQDARGLRVQRHRSLGRAHVLFTPGPFRQSDDPPWSKYAQDSARASN